VTFDWMTTPKPSRKLAKALAEQRERMYLDELQQRAGLLQRLRFSKDDARARLAARVRWDFEDAGGDSGAAALAAAVDGIVERAYARGSRQD